MHSQYIPKLIESAQLESVEDIRDLMLRVTRALREGKLDIRSGNALTFACKTALRAADLADGKVVAEHRAAASPLSFEIDALKDIVQSDGRVGVRFKALNQLRQLHRLAASYEARQVLREVESTGTEPGILDL